MPAGKQKRHHNHPQRVNDLVKEPLRQDVHTAPIWVGAGAVLTVIVVDSEKHIWN